VILIELIKYSKFKGNADILIEWILKIQKLSLEKLKSVDS